MRQIAKWRHRNRDYQRRRSWNSHQLTNWLYWRVRRMMKSESSGITNQLRHIVGMMRHRVGLKLVMWWEAIRMLNSTMGINSSQKVNMITSLMWRMIRDYPNDYHLMKGIVKWPQLRSSALEKGILNITCNKLSISWNKYIFSYI